MSVWDRFQHCATLGDGMLEKLAQLSCFIFLTPLFVDQLFVLFFCLCIECCKTGRIITDLSFRFGHLL